MSRSSEIAAAIESGASFRDLVSRQLRQEIFIGVARESFTGPPSDIADRLEPVTSEAWAFSTFTGETGDVIADLVGSGVNPSGDLVNIWECEDHPSGRHVCTIVLDTPERIPTLDIQILEVRLDLNRGGDVAEIMLVLEDLQNPADGPRYQFIDIEKGQLVECQKIGTSMSGGPTVDIQRTNDLFVLDLYDESWLAAIIHVARSRLRDLQPPEDLKMDARLRNAARTHLFLRE